MNPTLRAAALALSSLGLLSAAAAGGNPRDVVKKAKAEAVAIPKQAQALVELTWGDATDDPLVRAEARQELVHFGHYALPAVRDAIKTVDPVYQADATAVLIEARMRDRSGNPPDYLPGLEEALWHGSVEAKRIALHELARYPFPPAVLTTIDAIHLHPELTIDGLEALGVMRNPRGRYFLTRVLRHGAPRYKRVAARSLGQLGETGMLALRENARSAEAAVREAAIDALLPYATPDDLTMLHEYVGLRTEDDPAVVQRVRERAIELEALLEETQLSEAASADAGPDPEAEP